MFRRLLVLLTLALSLSSCVGGTAGLNAFVDSLDGYQFLYPLGWVETKIIGGPDVVLRDFIEPTENVSVVIGDLSREQTSLADLGSPSEVGQRLAQRVIAPPDSGRQAELLSARQRSDDSHDYYILEYAVTIGERQRHELASAVVSRGKLFTLSASTPARRWSKVQDMLSRVVESFKVY